MLSYRVIALAVLALSTYTTGPAMAVVQGTACSPTAPLNGAYCLNQTCSHLGTTMLDKDGQNIIACLNDASSGRLIWKSTSGTAPSAGGGGGAYTAYNTQSCAAGWTVAYTGLYPSIPGIGINSTIASPACISRVENLGPSTSFCAVCVK